MEKLLKTSAPVTRPSVAYHWVGYSIQLSYNRIYIRQYETAVAQHMRQDTQEAGIFEAEFKLNLNGHPTKSQGPAGRL